jgi:DNA-binding IclR family transcriptional regulator
MDPAVRQTLYKAKPMTGITPNTITQERELEAQLSIVRDRGFALDMEENELGAHCVAAPIHDGLGDIAGSISISGLAIRWSKRRLVELGDVIIKETRAISAMLGASDGAHEAGVGNGTHATAVVSRRQARSF